MFTNGLDINRDDLEEFRLVGTTHQRNSSMNMSSAAGFCLKGKRREARHPDSDICGLVSVWQAGAASANGVYT